MSSTDYSYFNPHNYNSPLPTALTDFWNNLINVDFRMLAFYSVNNTQLMTYVMIGITAVTLGYVTMKEDTSQKAPEPIKTSGGKKSKTFRKYKNPKI